MNSFRGSLFSSNFIYEIPYTSFLGDYENKFSVATRHNALATSSRPLTQGTVVDNGLNVHVLQ